MFGEAEKKFLEKWNVRSYFHMRYNEIVRNYEKDITKIFDTLKLNKNAEFNEISEVIIKYIGNCLKSGVFIE
jgi:hypothetical protein